MIEKRGGGLCTGEGSGKKTNICNVYMPVMIPEAVHIFADY